MVVKLPLMETELTWEAFSLPLLTGKEPVLLAEGTGTAVAGFVMEVTAGNMENKSLLFNGSKAD